MKNRKDPKPENASQPTKSDDLIREEQTCSRLPMGLCLEWKRREREGLRGPTLREN